MSRGTDMRCDPDHICLSERVAVGLRVAWCMIIAVFVSLTQSACANTSQVTRSFRTRLRSAWSGFWSVAAGSRDGAPARSRDPAAQPVSIRHVITADVCRKPLMDVPFCSAFRGQRSSYAREQYAASQ